MLCNLAVADLIVAFIMIPLEVTFQNHFFKVKVQVTKYNPISLVAPSQKKTFKLLVFVFKKERRIGYSNSISISQSVKGDCRGKYAQTYFLNSRTSSKFCFLLGRNHIFHKNGLMVKHKLIWNDLKKEKIKNN